MLIGPDLTPANVNRLAGKIHLAALCMRELVSDLISLVHDDLSAVQTWDLREVIVAASDAALAAKRPRRVQILFEVPKGILLQLVRSPVERVFFNVIGNAIEPMPHGGTIDVSAQKNVDSVLLAVEDTGVGIPDEVREHLFEPLSRAVNRKGWGSGWRWHGRHSEAKAETSGLNLPRAPDSSTGFRWTVPATGQRDAKVARPLGSPRALRSATSSEHEFGQLSAFASTGDPRFV
jgi:light-regulated signal transduction histidine kinase (bacteriophytochrome)